MPAFVEALWALVAPDARAPASPPRRGRGPAGRRGGRPSAGGGIAVGDPEASPDEAEETEKDEKDDEAATATTTTRPRRRNVDARSRFHALRALIAIVSASWRGAELLVGGAPDTSRGARAPAFHRDLSPLARLVRPTLAHDQSETSDAFSRVGAATREKAARLLFLPGAHGARPRGAVPRGGREPPGRARGCRRGGRRGEGVRKQKRRKRRRRRPFRKRRRMPNKKGIRRRRDARRAKKKSPRASRRRARVSSGRWSRPARTTPRSRPSPSPRTPRGCARRLGCTSCSSARRRRFRRRRAPAAGEALAKLVAADARAAEACVASGALAAIAAALPAADRLERDGTSDLEGDASANTLFAEAFGADTRTNARRPSRETGPSEVPTPFQTPRRRRRRRVETRE